MAKFIHLTQGLQTVIDDEDYEKVRQFRWYAARASKNTFRAISDGPGKSTLLHRFILDAPRNMEVDHIDGNSLNNMRNNLRLCTHQQNLSGQHTQSYKSSMYKGVTWRKDRNKWQASIKYNGKRISLGVHITQEDAAKAYDNMALKLFGEFARPNFKE
jgi:hypothetical protein